MANTLSPTLVAASLKKGAVTVLQNKWAALRSFTLQWETDPIKPLAICVIKKALSTSATLVDASNFEQGDTVIDPIIVTPHLYSQPFQISNADLNSGLRLEDLAEINAGTFADKISDIVLAPVTVGNFGPATVISAAAAFGLSDLSTLYAALKKSSVKNLIIDGAYFSRISNQPGFFQPTGTQSGAAWKPYGWDYIGEHTRWDGAGPNIVGLACSPKAIGIVAGLPVAEAIPGNILQRSSFNLPGLDIEVAQHLWFSAKTRTFWASFDIMLGSELGDATAGKLVTFA